MLKLVAFGWKRGETQQNNKIETNNILTGIKPVDACHFDIGTNILICDSLSTLDINQIDMEIFLFGALFFCPIAIVKVWNFSQAI